MKILDNQIENSTVGQSYLFVGPAGCDKLQEARNFAAKLASQFDIQELAPQGANGYLSKQIKDLIANANLTPISGEKKVYIINSAELLGSAGANAFLKTLEEPPSFDIFILLANNIDNVLPTIVSRCQVINFKSLPQSKAQEIVTKNSGAAPEDAEAALELYGGDIAEATKLLGSQDLQDFCDEVDEIASKINKLNEWQLLARSKDIVTKIHEICDTYKYQLEQKKKDLNDVLSPGALKEVAQQNKRAVTAKQRELLHLFCNVLNRNFRAKALMNPKYITAMNLVGKYEAMLAYNTRPQNFCDVVLLKLKEV